MHLACVVVVQELVQVPIRVRVGVGVRVRVRGHLVVMRELVQVRRQVERNNVPLVSPVLAVPLPLFVLGLIQDLIDLLVELPLRDQTRRCTEVAHRLVDVVVFH